MFLCFASELYLIFSSNGLVRTWDLYMTLNEHLFVAEFVGRNSVGAARRQMNC